MTQHTDSKSDVEAYFEQLHSCTVAEASHEHIVLTDIPYSGGAHMLPGSFGALEVLADDWGDYDIDYEPDGTHRFGREKKCVVITRGGGD